MGEMALVVLGLFVLVWIISAVVKASQDPGTRRTGPSASGRPRPPADATPQRTSNSDIDRFMAEIDRLRRRGEGAPSGGRPPQPRPAPPILERAPRPLSQSEPRPRSLERRERDRERERRPRPTSRPAPTPAPPPLPRSEPVPVLRPVAPERPTAPERPAAPLSTPPIPPKPARPAKPATAAAVTGVIATPSPVLQALQSVLTSKQGPAAALILAEIFGPPKGLRVLPHQRPTQRQG
jgi:hypothetical protein